MFEGSRESLPLSTETGLAIEQLEGFLSAPNPLTPFLLFQDSCLGLSVEGAGETLSEETVSLQPW